MRRFSLFSFALLAFIAAHPLLLRAQFQPPSEEELKMTADPKAPGAAEVYLDYEETDVSDGGYKNYYARIKVLTEKGKEAATVWIDYLKGYVEIGGISGRTIHSDGTIVPLTVKPADLLEVKSGNIRYQRKVFNMPSVEVGSILEYSYQVRNTWQTPTWWVQRRFFVHKEHFSFTPIDAVFATLIWWPNLPPGASVKKDVAGRFTLDIADIPPAPDEEWMPPVNSILYKVRFYYASPYGSLDVEDYWKEGAKEWSKEVEKFAEPTKAIQEAARSLVQPSDSDIDKAKKLYAAVQELDNTDFSRSKTESERHELKLKEVNRAEDAWAQKSGNRNQIALLYLAILRAAGLTAFAMQVVNRDDDTFDPSYMTLWQFDDEVVILSTGGKEIVLDPGEKMCPFGVVNWRHSGVKGLRQNADGPALAVTPQQTFGINTVRREGDLTLDAQGGVSGTVEMTMAGQNALAWRQAALKSDESELKKEFDQGLEAMVPTGVEAHVDHFLALDEPERNLMVVVKVKGSLGSATSKRLIIPGFFFESRSDEPFVSQEKRLEPVDMHYGEQLTDQLTYHLPRGFTVEGAPPDARVAWESHALYVAKTKTDSGQMIVARVLARAFAEARASDYQDLRSFFQKVATGDQAQIVLSTASAAKEN